MPIEDIKYFLAISWLMLNLAITGNTAYHLYFFKKRCRLREKSLKTFNIYVFHLLVQLILTLVLLLLVYKIKNLAISEIIIIGCLFLDSIREGIDIENFIKNYK